MYRIELSPGEETAFRSIEELAVAIRRGVVTSKARIWHNASNKWLPIQFHPHYKAAAAMPLSNADLVVGPPVTPLASLHLPDPAATASRVTPFRPVSIAPQPEPPAPAARVEPFKPASPYHQPEAKVPAAPTDLPFIEPLGSVSLPQHARPEPLRMEPARPVPPKPQPVKAPVLKPQPLMRVDAPAEETPRKKTRSRARKSSRRALRVAFVGSLLIAGAQVLVSAVPSLRTEALRAQRRLIAMPPEVSKRDSPRTVAAVIPALRNSSVPGGAGLSRSSTPQATRVPGPTIAPIGSAVPTPSPAAPTVVDSIPEIQPAPEVEIPSAAPAVTDSLTSNLKDSTSKKALKGILKAVSGAPASEKSSPKR